MEGIARTIIIASTLWMYTVHHSFAQCDTPHLNGLLEEANNSILEGATQQSQGILFSAGQEIHCLVWNPEQIDQYLYLKGMYAHLQNNARDAEKYFQNRSPSQYPEFGIDMMQYASYFHNTTTKMPIRIHRSRFQQLMLDGDRIVQHKTYIRPGYHLIQLLNKSNTPVHAQWLYIDENSKPNIHLPRFAPNWMLYLASSNIAVGGFSWFMRGYEQEKMNTALDEEQYRKAQRARSLWTTTGISFFVVGITMYGIYFVW